MISFYICVGCMIAYAIYWNYDFYFHYKRSNKKEKDR